MGDQASRAYYGVLAFLPYFCWWPLAEGIPSPHAYLPFFSLPLAILNSVSCFRIIDRRDFNSLLARTAGLQLLFGLLASAALVISK